MENENKANMYYMYFTYLCLLEYLFHNHLFDSFWF